MFTDEQLRQLTREMIDKAKAEVAVPLQLPATVLTDSTAVATVTVAVDGDEDATPVVAENLTGLLFFEGDRVMVQFQPPAGVFVTHQIGGVRGGQVIREFTQTAVTSFDITDIPDGFGRLQLEMSGVTSVDNQLVSCRVNGESGTVYRSFLWRVNASNASGVDDATALAAQLRIANWRTDAASTVILDFHRASSATAEHAVDGQGGHTNSAAGSHRTFLVRGRTELATAARISSLTVLVGSGTITIDQGRLLGF